MVLKRLLPPTGLAALLIAIVCAAPGAWAMDKTISVVIDQAHLVNLPEGTATLIIGNPTIADVTMVGAKGAMMVLTPKAYGETNVIALDNNGTPLTESVIRVVGGTDALVLQKGMERQSYTCAPTCQTLQKLGDDSKYFANSVEQAKAYNTGASSIAPPTSVSAAAR